MKRKRGHRRKSLLSAIHCRKERSSVQDCLATTEGTVKSGLHL